MIKIFKRFMVLSMLLTIFGPFVTKIDADDAGYYYESIDIQVIVNEKREFEIVETLNVFYEEEKHGIVRSIPESSSVESYWISDIHVEGAPFTVEDYYDGKEIWIGDADETVEGPMTYTVSYTLGFYQDYDQSSDFIYLNLIGTDFDTHINKLTASISYPESAVFEKWTVTEGDYGSRNNDNISVEHSDNTLYFESRSPIQAYEAVTVQIQLNQGTFSEAPLYTYPYIIKEKIIEIEVNEQQEFKVFQKILIDANDTYTYYPLTLDMYAFDYAADIAVKDFSGTVDGRQIDSEYSVSMDNPGEHEIILNYVLRAKKIQHGDLTFELQDSYEDTQVQKLKFSIKLPEIYSYGVTFNRYNDPLDKSRYSIEEKDSTLFFESLSTLQAAETARIDVFVNQEDYNRPVPVMIYAVPAAGTLFLLAVLYLKFFKYRNEAFSDPISFYPPDGINSAEAGYLIDNRLSDEDITSLIFQWAAYGSLRIEGISERYSLVKVKDLPAGCPFYERCLFNSMFNHGDDDRQVSEDDLKYSFYTDIERARKEIVEKYKKTVVLIEPVSLKVGKICTGIAAVFPLVMLIVIQFIEASEGFMDGFSIMFSIISMMPFLMMLFLFFLFKRMILATGNHVMRIVLAITVGIPWLIVFFTTSVFVETYSGYFMYSCAICILTMAAAGSIKQRTKEGTRLMNELRGFRKFIKTAEKQQLEMLLEESPEYYYEILPYAQTLKVTKIWQDKFDGIALQPPVWYISTDPYSYDSFNRFYRDMTRTMKNSAARPVSTGDSSDSSSSGGGYSGGGGGFSSGGFSGGGSGGGGSRSW